MPRYNYQCAECLRTMIIVHGINEVLADCQKCGAIQSMQKLLSTPMLMKTEPMNEEKEIGQTTKEYIEANRNILNEEKEKSKRKLYEPA